MRRGLPRAGVWSETASIVGAPPSLAEPHRWGISTSRSGEFHPSVINIRSQRKQRSTPDHVTAQKERRQPRPVKIGFPPSNMPALQSPSELSSHAGTVGFVTMAAVNGGSVLTSKDIARICGVSQSTVSRVLSSHPNVSAKTREAVTLVLKETGFVPNAAARAMRTHRAKSIGVVVSTPVNQYGLEVMGHVHEHIAPYGLQLSVWLADEDGNAFDALQALRERSVDGLIYTTAVDRMPELEAAIDAGAAIVLMGRTMRGVGTDTVAGANGQGGARVAEYLVQNGRRKIALVGGRAFSPGREIEDGFRRRLKGLGVPLDGSV